MEQGPFMDLIRHFFSFLDSIIYGLIGDSYNLIIEIAHYKIFDNESIAVVTNKVYAVLGIFMLFKVSFSFVNYMVNPDSFTDKEKGVQKIITNIVVMFAMLVMCPWAFEQLWNLQAVMLDEDIVGNFVFGEEDRKLQEYKMMDDCEQYSMANSNGDYIALMVLKGFYRPYTEEEVGYDLSSSFYDTDYDEVRNILCDKTNTGMPSHYLIQEVYNADADVDGWSLFTKDLDIYIMDYKVGISTAVGLVVLLILVVFAMDVGLRMVKLSFLEILAPIPIVSYIDPASGKNGMFKKWLKEVGSTWISIFIRLLAVLFAVRVIQEVGSLTKIGQTTSDASVWVYIFVIIGALMFAKQLPKLIQNITGINLDGGFSINPLKKVRDQALGGKLVAGAATGVAAGGLALVGGAAANTWATRKNNAKIKNELAKNGITSEDPNFKQEFKARGGRNLVGYASTMTAGGLSSAGRAVVKGKDGTWHPLKNAKSGITESSKSRNARADGWGIGDRMRDNLTDMAQIKSTTGTTSERKNEIKQLQMELENYKRDEQRYSMSLSNIESANGGKKSSLYADAFRYNPIKDSEGNWTYEKATPNTYDDWMKERLGVDVASIEAGIRRDFESIPEFSSYDSKTKERYIRDSLDHYVTKNYGNAALTKSEYEIYNELYDKRNAADLAGKKTEASIKKKEEQITSRKGNSK